MSPHSSISILLAAGILSAGLSVFAQQSQQAPGYYRGKLGAFEITVLSNGVAPRHMNQILSRPEVAVAEYGAVHEPQPVNLSINAYLVNTGSHLVLIDTGAGDLFGLSSGHLVANYESCRLR